MGNFCYRCMQATVANGVCTKCGELESTGKNNGDNALQPGTTLAKGRVTVGKKLGSGGFGVTYIAYDHKLNRRVALKEFMPNYLATRQGIRIVPKSGQNEAYQKAMNSFMKEARTLYELRAHPNIVHVISVFQENNTAFYTMEMLEGESFLNYLRRKKKISANRAFQMMLPIMKAIQYVHTKNMIHRDISPDNIMLCEDPSRPGVVVPKLIDFGAAHVAIEGYSLSYPGVKKNGFSPLEQNWEGKTQGPWTDVYSFCATFYSAIVGVVPTSAQARSESDKDPLKLPRDAGADIIPEMQDALMRGMRIQYTERTQSMEQLIAEMSKAVQSPGNTTHPTSRGDDSPQPVGRPTVQRLFAWLLEIFLAGAGAAALIYFKVADMIGLEDFSIVFVAAAILGTVFLFDLLFLATARSTFGQLLFALKVRGEDGEGSPGFGNILVYDLFYASFGFLVGAVCGFIWLVSGKNIGPLERLCGVTVGRRRERSVSAQGLSGIISANVSKAAQPGKSEPAKKETPAPEQQVIQGAQDGSTMPAEAGQKQAAKPASPSAPGPQSGAKPPVRQSSQSGQQPQKYEHSKLDDTILPNPFNRNPSGQGKPVSSQSTPATPQSNPVSPPSKPVAVQSKPISAPSNATAHLVCLKAAETAAEVQGKAVTIRDGSRLGKSQQKANIVIPDRTVSGLHCSFHFVQGKGWTIKDEESTNGTYVNGVRLPAGGTSSLKNGVQIVTGKETFNFMC